MKTITIQLDWPRSLHASDSDGQWMRVERLRIAGEPSDSDICLVESARNDPNDPNDLQQGSTQWGRAFSGFADFFNCTSLDGGWND